MRAFFWILCSSAALQVHPQFFEWTQLPSFPGTARDDASAFTIGSTIHVGTGRDVSFALTSDWYAYDIGDQSWTTIAPLPASGRQYCAAFTDGVYGYLFGGVDANGPLNELWRYDPSVDAWEEMPALPGAGRYATVAFSNGMVCTGVLNGGISTNECWLYDATSGTWAQRAEVPGPPRHRASGSGDLVQVIGGADAEGNALSDRYGYDPDMDEWATLAPLPAARIGADAVYDDALGTTYLVGGASSPTEFHNDAWEENGSGWSPLAPFTGGPRRGAVMAFVEDVSTPTIRFVFYGTGVDTEQRHNDWWVYTVLTESIAERTSVALRSFPNPSTGEVHFELPIGTSTSGMVHDITGRVVMTGPVSANGTLDLSGLRSGEYMIRIVESGRTYHSRTSIIHP